MSHVSLRFPDVPAGLPPLRQRAEGEVNDLQPARALRKAG